MKPVSLAVYFVGVAAFAVSLFLPANSDWLGFFWATFALEIAMRGPQGIADYPLFLLVSAANVLVLLTPLAFAGAKAWGRIVAHLLVVATLGGGAACLFYRPKTWDMGYYAWCVALAILAVAIYLRAASPSPALGAVPESRRPLGALRRTRAQ